MTFITYGGVWEFHLHTHTHTFTLRSDKTAWDFSICYRNQTIRMSQPIRTFGMLQHSVQLKTIAMTQNGVRSKQLECLNTASDQNIRNVWTGRPIKTFGMCERGVRSKRSECFNTASDRNIRNVSTRRTIKTFRMSQCSIWSKCSECLDTRPIKMLGLFQCAIRSNVWISIAQHPDENFRNATVQVLGW